MSSHNIKPGRRRAVSLRNSSRNASALLFFLFLLTLLRPVQALVPGAPVGLGRFSPYLAPRQDPLANGGTTTTQSPTQSPTKTKATTKSTTSESEGSSSASASASATTGSSAQLSGVPKVFDTDIGANFTVKACQQFLEGLSDDPNFQKCLPLSLLLSVSTAFSDDYSKGLLPQVLDDTCNVAQSTCNNVMQGFALKLKSNDVCAEDYNNGNPLVHDAYNGFLAYTPMYQAGCLKVNAQGAATTSSSSQPTQGLSSNSSSNSSSSSEPEYCFIASTASSDKSPMNAYVYALPLGSAIPDSGNVNCTDCLRETMNIFAKAATNATSPLSTLYPQAAQEINAQCGKNWVPATITVDKSTQPSAASSVRPSGTCITLVIAALAMFGLW